MKYILDFDHTLMDTKTFVQQVEKDNRMDTLVTPEIWEYYNVRDFLYPDVLPFLESKNKEDIIILTAMTPSLGDSAEDFQREKLKRAEFDNLVSETIFIVGEKGPHIKNIYTGDETVFIDDKFEQIQSSLNYCPEVTCYLIDRYKEVTEVFSGIKVINSLDELTSHAS